MRVVNVVPDPIGSALENTSGSNAVVQGSTAEKACGRENLANVPWFFGYHDSSYTLQQVATSAWKAVCVRHLAGLPQMSPVGFLSFKPVRRPAEAPPLTIPLDNGEYQSTG